MVYFDSVFNLFMSSGQFSLRLFFSKRNNGLSSPCVCAFRGLHPVPMCFRLFLIISRKNYEFVVYADVTACL